MRNLIISGLKTAVQVAIAALVAWLASLGLALPADAAVALEAGVFAVVTGAVTLLLNAAGQRWPIVNLILSFGLSRETATY